MSNLNGRSVAEFAKLDDSMVEATVSFIGKHLLTEEKTDLAIEYLLNNVPMKIGPIPIPKAIARRVLDHLLPEKLLDMLVYLATRD